MPAKTTKSKAPRKKWKGEPQLIRSITVVEKELLLREEKCFGQVIDPHPKHSAFAVDPRQPAEEYMDTIIHETVHILCPSWSEDQVRHASEVISTLLWMRGYRRIYQDDENTVREPGVAPVKK